LPSERFIAFAINCVSSVPAEPTTVPAMIIAALFSTKPSKATASPVNALYKDMTTGMSAPPMGSVMLTPSTSASTKMPVMTAGDEFSCAATRAPSASAPMRMMSVRNFCPPKRRLPWMRPCSLPNAMALPLKETAPMMPPTTARVLMETPAAPPRYSSTAAIAAAAPPPMPL
jgi:hypothetical protein